jgi:putative acyl-CoA dehydrogenase
MDPLQRSATNQVPPLTGHDVLTTDRSLLDGGRAVADRDQGDLTDSLRDLGRLAGSPEAREHALLANRHSPELATADRWGNRIDEVRFHPSWHWLLEHGVRAGLQAAPWTDTGPYPHLRRAIGFYVWSQVESGNGCPLSMTYAAVPALRTDEVLAKEWVPGLAATTYEFGLTPPTSKAGLLAGMGMTEKQGGSDVRANVTAATPTSVDGEYVLRGHKWFCSAPMNDVFLMLAQAPGGLSCFVAPRVLPDGSRNPFAIVRLKDKLGNRSNASAEIELDGTLARRLGDEGRGVRTIIEMVAATRLDCVLGSAGLMRRAVAEATWHAAHRHAFGTVLAEQPAMTNVLADLAVEAEAALRLGLRLAAAVDRPDDEHEQALRRIGLPLAKFWVCKRTPFAVAEALECLGGNGYVEESGMPLLFRESPLNSIWEGSGNVNALDVLRALRREPVALDAWLREVGGVRGEDPRLDAAVTDVLAMLSDLEGMEHRARRLTARMATCLQAALLLRHGDAAVADAFCASRLAGDWGGTFGTLPHGIDVDAIVRRATPTR